ncbi:MAG: hypothetical protein ABIG10_03805 [bacterium]
MKKVLFNYVFKKEVDVQIFQIGKDAKLFLPDLKPIVLGIPALGQFHIFYENDDYSYVESGDRWANFKMIEELDDRIVVEITITKHSVFEFFNSFGCPHPSKIPVPEYYLTINFSANGIKAKLSNQNPCQTVF